MEIVMRTGNNPDMERPSCERYAERLGYPKEAFRVEAQDTD